MRKEWRTALAIYVLCTGVYAAVAGQRLLRQSTDTHFVYLAEGWLKKRLDLGGQPPHTNDWAEVEYLTLKDGRTLAGQFLRTQPGRFRTLDGKHRDMPAEIIAKRDKKYFVSFPPFPAVLMLPLVALFGLRTNDVLFSVLLAGVGPALLYVALRRLPRRLHRPGSEAAGEEEDPDRDLWLVVMFAFGSVYFFTSVVGQVWFTAHVVSIALCGLFLLCVLPPRWPLLAGALCGALMMTRPAMAAVAILWGAELVRLHAPDGRYPLSRAQLASVRWRPVAVALLAFVAAALVVVVPGLVHNVVRFGRPLEFGHSYLQTMQADNIQRFGLVNYQYLSRNLAAAFTLLPKILPQPPFVQVSFHGLSLFITTPVLLYLLWPEREAEPGPQDSRPLRRLLWLTAAPIALFALLYQNTGYVQFGYRFSLDCMLLLVLLLRLGSPRAIGSWRFRILVLAGIGVNLFGALTFGRMWQFYWNGLFPVM